MRKKNRCLIIHWRKTVGFVPLPVCPLTLDATITDAAATATALKVSTGFVAITAAADAEGRKSTWWQLEKVHEDQR